MGLDDFARFDLVSSGGSVKYQVLAGQKVLAETDVLTSGETAAISCAVPSGTTELTLRVTNAGDGNAVDYADWLYPYLYQKKSDFDGVEKNLYADNNLGGNSKVNGSVLGARFATEKDFTAVTLNPESAADTVTASLYKFIYSYERSLQGGALCTVSAQKNSSGKYVFALNREYRRGRIPARFRRSKGNRSQRLTVRILLRRRFGLQRSFEYVGNLCGQL